MVTPERRSEAPLGARKFKEISTRWSVLQGPPREALDYLYRAYGAAIRSYLQARLARGDFSPLAACDADDLLQDFFLRLGSSEWLRKPDANRGKFRPYLLQRLVFFLRERRVLALGRPIAEMGARAAVAIAEVATPDPLDAHFERDWESATVHECLRRIGSRNADWRAALETDLRRENETDAEVAARLGWTVDSLRSALKRARRAFRELYRIEERRLDGFGGGEFRSA